jgi:hypothetical protein
MTSINKDDKLRDGQGDMWNVVEVNENSIIIESLTYARFHGKRVITIKTALNWLERANKYKEQNNGTN